MILGFYDIINSLLERISLLENKMPADRDYRMILMRVFSSIVVLCGKATQVVEDKRLSK